MGRSLKEGSSALRQSRSVHQTHKMRIKEKKVRHTEGMRRQQYMAARAFSALDRFSGQRVKISRPIVGEMIFLGAKACFCDSGGILP